MPERRSRGLRGRRERGRARIEEVGAFTGVDILLFHIVDVLLCSLLTNTAEVHLLRVYGAELGGLANVQVEQRKGHRRKSEISLLAVCFSALEGENMTNKPDIISRIHNELISYCEPLITITRRTERKRKHTKIFVIFLVFCSLWKKTKKTAFETYKRK